MFKRIIRVSILSICIGGLLGACSPGQKTDITPDNAGKVQLLNTFRLPESPVGEFNRCSLAFSPDGSLLAGSCSNRVPVWDVGSGKVKYTLYEGFQSQIVDCQFNTDGRTIACGGYDLVITMFNAANGKPIGSLGSVHRQCARAALPAT